MTRQKDLKRKVRSRMQKTGEAYTTARARLLDKKRAPSPAAPRRPAPDVTRAGMSDDAVQAKTGRTWAEWVSILDAVGADRMAHRDIARHLHEVHDVPAWWTQMITVGYERMRGLRAVGQRRSGTWEINKSKTLPVPIDALYAAFATPRARGRWLGDARPKVRKATANKCVRLEWPDGTKVEAYFTAKGGSKSQVSVQHRGLSSKADSERLRAYWTERLTALAGVLG